MQLSAELLGKSIGTTHRSLSVAIGRFCEVPAVRAFLVLGAAGRAVPLKPSDFVDSPRAAQADASDASRVEELISYFLRSVKHQQLGSRAPD